MEENKPSFDELYRKNLEKQNTSPYFESSFPNKKPNSKFMAGLVILAFVLVFFVITFSIVTAVNNETIETVTVTLNYYGDKVETKALKKDELFTLPSTPEREGYKFVGWYEDSNYSTRFDSLAGIKKDTTLYAKWDVLSFTIRFETGETYSVKYGDEFIIPSNSTFGFTNILGWTTKKDSVVVEYRAGDSFIVPAENTVFYCINS